MSNQKLNSTQIVSLVVMVTAIVVGWIAYHNYQPKLLEQYDLTEYAFFLVVAQGLILIITPPIAGHIGDRFRKRGSHRFRIIALGVGFAAMIFMTVALGLATLPDSVVALLLPILVVFWLIAMNIFTSPAISTFELFAPFERQPMALAILTLTAELLYALEPVIVPIIDSLGGVVTFFTGGVLVIVAGLLLRKTSTNVPDPFSAEEGPKKSSWGEVLFAGLRLGIPTALVFNMLPDVLSNQLADAFPNVNGAWWVSGMLALAGLVCLPLGKVATQWGLQRSQRLSFTVMLVAAILIFLNAHWAVTLFGAVVFAMSLSMQSVSSLPFALTRIASFQKVLGVGVFFAGVEIPNAILEIYLGFPK